MNNPRQMLQPFAGVSASALRALAAALRSGQLGPAITKMAVQRVAPSADGVAAELARLAGEGMAPSHMALLLDVAAQSAEARMGGWAPVELVWTGPEGTESHSRDTLVVVHELFERAERHVTVSTFVVRQTARIFDVLARRMDEREALAVRIFLHVPRDDRDRRHDSEILREFSDVLVRSWPGTRRPEVYYDPRALLADSSQRATWHAKCVLIDEDIAFVTSANFTEWAHQRNVEAGVLVRDRHFASQLRGQFDSLVQGKQVRRLPGF